MFNDLNQTNQPVTPNPVDDIFAETDKSAEAKKTSAYYPGDLEIEANKVGGLDSSEQEAPSLKGKIIKIVLFSLLVILLLTLGYLAYTKFFANKAAVDLNQPVVPVNTVTETPVDNTPVQPVEEVATTTPVSQESTTTPGMPIATTTPPVSSLIDTDSDGLMDEEEKVLGTNLNLIDTDNDGLTDYEEVKIHNTNPLIADTDDDGLPDYDEVKIYKTDPKNPDTDGDAFLDGAEVKGGYNPLGAGKLIEKVK